MIKYGGDTSGKKYDTFNVEDWNWLEEGGGESKRKRERRKRKKKKKKKEKEKKEK